MQNAINQIKMSLSTTVILKIWTRGLVITLLILVGMILSTGSLHAQAANGSITGRVTDSTGAIIAHTDVILTRTDTGLVLESPTNGDGFYNFPSLQTGPFVVEVDRPGFKAARATITLGVDQTAQVDIKLVVGVATESVTVQADSTAELNTQDSALAYTVGATQVAELPLNGRNPYALASLSPGIFPGTSFGAGVSTQRGAVVAAAANNFESNGGIGGSNEVMLDGVSIVVCCQGQPAVTLSVEAVDQFKVLTSVPPSLFGRSSGAVLNIVSKTGGNALHGDLYEYLRNDQLDAAGFFAKRGSPPIPGRNDFRGPHKFNQYGGFVSGPVFIPKIYDGRNTAFFTFGYEGLRNVTTAFTIATVPTALMRQGIFTEAPSLIYDPYNVATTGTTTVRQPIAAACVGSTCYPAGRAITTIRPAAAKLLALVPAPNNSALTNNYAYSPGTQDKDSQYNFRIDYDWKKSNRSFIRGTRGTNSNHVNDLFNQQSGAGSKTQAITNYLFAAGDTWTVSPTFLLQFTYGFARQTNIQLPGNFGTNFNPVDYGFSGNLAAQQQVEGLPLTTFNGLSNIGQSNSQNVSFHYSHILDATATLQRGNHNIVFGYDGRYILENEKNVVAGVGTEAYDTTLTNGPNPSGVVPSGQAPFDSFAAFLLRAPTTSQIGIQSSVAFTQPYNAVFVQDDWRLRPRFTVNLGLRYDIETGFRERHNHWADIDPAVTNPLSAATGLPFTGGAQYLGVNGNPNRTWKTHYKDFSPRLGFSWNPFPKTVVRAAFGMLWLPTSQRVYTSGTLGYSVITTVQNTSNATPQNSLEDPFPTGVSQPAGASLGLAAGVGTSVTGFLYDTPVSQQNQWNAGIEQQLGNGFVFSLNYTGGHGVHLPITGQPNNLQPQFFGAPGDTNQIAYLNKLVVNPFAGKVAPGSLNNATVPQAQLLAAFPQYQGVNYVYQGRGSASFNGLQTGLTFRRRGGFTGSVFYSWSKLLGNVSDITNGFLNPTGNPGPQNYYFFNSALERTNLATDVPHRIVGNFVYPLPFGRGHRFASNIPEWTDVIIGGWKLNGIESIQSGFPLSYGQTGTQPYAGSRPTFVPGVNPLTTGSTHTRLGGTGNTPYLNPAAFRLSRAFELGNVPRSVALTRGPLTFQDDLSAIKDIPIHEAVSLQFRLEAFNFLNRVNFGSPNTTVNSSNFGQINSQVNLPRNVQVALKLFF